MSSRPADINQKCKVKAGWKMQCSMADELCPAGGRKELFVHTCMHEYLSWRLIFQSLSLPFSKSEMEWLVILCLWPHKVYDLWICNSWFKLQFPCFFMSSQVCSAAVLFKEYGITEYCFIQGFSYTCPSCISLKQQIQYISMIGWRTDTWAQIWHHRWNIFFILVCRGLPLTS